MIVSFTRQFIFVHVVKAAGMSIEASLWPYDVRSDLTGSPPSQHARLLEGIGINSAIFGLGRHATVLELRNTLGPEVFGRMFKFAFVRNPWDFELSLYHFNLDHPEFPGHQRAKKARDFEDFVLSADTKVPLTGIQKRFIADEDGKILVDFVGRFENLAADFAKVCGHIGVSAPLQQRNQTKHPPWQECYTLEMFDRVRTKSQVDIEAFGYPADSDHYAPSGTFRRR